MSKQNNIVNKHYGHLEIQEGTTRIDESAFAYNAVTSVTIPESVTSIGGSAFWRNELKNVRIPDSVTSIGAGAFWNNYLQGSVTIPDSVTSIDAYTFGGGNSITSVTIGTKVSSIGYNAFVGNRLTSVKIPDAVTSIGNQAFSYNNLTSITIGNNVTSIGHDAFSFNKLTNVVIPDSVTTIGNFAFKDNRLTSVTIGHKVTSIGNYAFGTRDDFANGAYKNLLTSITIPDSVTSIDYGAFERNKLTSVTIGNKVTSIGERAFAGNQLTSVTIPDSVTSIGNRAFWNNKLTSVNIPESVTSIDSGAFFTNDLKYITMPAIFNTEEHKARIFGSSKFNSISYIVNGHLKISEGTEHIADNAYEKLQLTSVEIPDLVTSIGSHAFRHNKLTSVTIGNKVTSIADNAFAINKLTSVEIPDSVISIGKKAFWNNKLTSVRIPDLVTRINESAFSGNELTSVEIPDSITSIEERAFAGNQLTHVTIGTKVTVIGHEAFYRNALTSVQIPESVTNIGNYAFAGNQLTSVTIGNKVTSIGERAFAGNQLTTIKIPDSVTNIGNYAFDENKLTSVTIGNEVTSIGDKAFYKNQLTHVTIGIKVTSIGREAFNTNALTSVTIPDSVTSIGDNAFINNPLKSARIPVRLNDDKEKARIFGPNFKSILNIVNGYLKIPQETTHIDTYAFQRMQLTSVEIPQSVTSIGEYAFAENRLTSVEIPESVTSIGRGAFDNNKLTHVALPNLFYKNFTLGKKQVIFGNDWTKINFTRKIDDFFRAVESQDSNAIEEIINQGININEKNSMGQTALIYASEKGLTQIVDILLYHEANTHIIDTKGKNALMYAVELNHTSFIASLVDKMAPTAREITYRERIKNLNPYFLTFLNSERPDFTNQLRAYINSDHDYLQNINDFVISNCNATDNILIIDFDNIAYNTIERQSSSSSLYTLPTNGARTTTSLLPNVTDNEMISYKSAVLLVLRYAKENLFTNIIAITKNSQFLKQFKQEYNELKTNGKITITQNKNGTIINSVFNDMDLQTYLSSTKVSVISVESKIDSIQAPTSELGSLLSDADFKRYIHRLKGTDDSLIILISKAIKQNFTRRATVMSDDGNMIRDFKADYTYTCPFLTKIHVNSNLQSEFVVNFTNDYLALIETQIINNQQVTDNNVLFTRVIKPSNDDIKTYYYSVSTRSGTGFDVRNWYSRSGSTIGNPVINAIFNEPKKYEPLKPIQYINTNNRPYMPVLNPSGKPYLSQDGTIAKLKNNPTIPYLTETWNNTTQTYTYTPAQDNNRNYYTNTNNNNQYDTIEIFDWQPYAKKYVSTNNSSGEHVEYYQKYMKYKAKYNELKEKLGL